MEIVSRAFNSSLSLFLLFTLAGCADLRTRIDQLEAENNAQQAEIDALNDQFMELEICTPGAPTRFIDNGDGTVCDSETGLMWEKKVDCQCIDVHEISNSYTWTAAEGGFYSATPTGTVFSDFLRRLNQGRFAGYSDWRIPTGEEARTLFSEPDPIGQNCAEETRDEMVCTHPIFGLDRGTWTSNQLLYHDMAMPRDYWQFVWPDNNERSYTPRLTTVRAVRGSMR